MLLTHAQSWDDPLSVQALQSLTRAVFTLASNISGLRKTGLPRGGVRGGQPPWGARGETTAALRPKVNSNDGRWRRHSGTWEGVGS